jgi:hypothetical protein
MTTDTVRRWGAVLLAGGLCLTAAYVMYPSSARIELIHPAASLGLVGILLLLPGLFFYQRAQSARASTNGWIGTSILCLGLGLLEIPHLLLGVFSPSSLYDLDAYHSSVWGLLSFLGVIIVAVGLIVLAVATRRADVYPRWAVWALAGDVLVSAVGSIVGPLGNALRVLAPSYLLASVCGLAMLSLARSRDEAGRGVAVRVTQPDPQTSGAR